MLEFRRRRHLLDLVGRLGHVARGTPQRFSFRFAEVIAQHGPKETAEGRGDEFETLADRLDVFVGHSWIDGSSKGERKHHHEYQREKMSELINDPHEEFGDHVPERASGSLLPVCRREASTRENPRDPLDEKSGGEKAADKDKKADRVYLQKLEERSHGFRLEHCASERNSMSSR